MEKINRVAQWDGRDALGGLSDDPRSNAGDRNVDLVHVYVGRGLGGV
ncbi:hypothetical protein ACO0K2_08805 [Undibacterium sp. MH2W]